MFGFLQNIFGNGCCSCNKKREKSELIMDKNNNNKKQIENNEIKDIKSIDDSLIEYNIDEANDYYNKFKDNDSYNDYVINMESIIGIKEIEKENNYLLENIILEK